MCFSVLEAEDLLRPMRNHRSCFKRLMDMFASDELHRARFDAIPESAGIWFTVSLRSDLQRYM
jgi:hypothetical protein